MEIDSKDAPKGEQDEFQEHLPKRRPRQWGADNLRVPKVRRILSIGNEEEKDFIVVSILFVPIDVKRDPIKTEFKLDRQAKNRDAVHELAKRHGIPIQQIVLRFVNNDTFKLLCGATGEDVVEGNSSKIVAYQVPQLRARAKKLTRELNHIPSSFVKDFEVLNSIIYHRPFRFMKCMEGIRTLSDWKWNHSTKWLTKAFNVNPDSNIPPDFWCHFERIISAIRETSSMEQYALLTVVREGGFSGWKHISIPQYIPYKLKETTFKELRERATEYARRILKFDVEPAFFGAIVNKPMHFRHTGSQSLTKGRLTANIKTCDFPSDGSLVITSRVSLVLCTV